MKTASAALKVGLTTILIMVLSAVAYRFVAKGVRGQEGPVVWALFRDATGLGRKRAIQILEFFDRIGFLRRVGDTHLLRPGTPLFPPGSKP